MNEDRFAAALLAVIFIGASAAGFAIRGAHPLFNSLALGLGAAFWWMAREKPRRRIKEGSDQMETKMLYAAVIIDRDPTSSDEIYISYARSDVQFDRQAERQESLSAAFSKLEADASWVPVSVQAAIKENLLGLFSSDLDLARDDVIAFFVQVAEDA